MKTPFASSCFPREVRVSNNTNKIIIIVDFVYPECLSPFIPDSKELSILSGEICIL